MFRIFLILWCASAAPAAEAIIQDRSHSSRVLGETRDYRVFLPPDYQTSGKRYPVIYWFHGWSQRYNDCGPDPERDYDVKGYGGDTIARYVAGHDVIVVKWDGYNPRTPGEKYPRPYNVSPVETGRQFPLYFPELVAHIDATYRTIPDRAHRATAGLSMGGFMSFWIAGKYPDLVSSASNFMGSAEFFVGPRGFDVEYNHDDMHGNYAGVQTRLVTGSRDFIQYYHRRMNAIWKYTRLSHETEDFPAEHGTPGMARTLDFHMRAFAHPLARPAVWSHADVYPNFSVWGWEVGSNRRRPGVTWLENVSAAGFRSSVREWLPAGPVLPAVRLLIGSPPLYARRRRQVVTIIRLRDGHVRRRTLTAAADGRLSLELDGEECEVGIGAGPIPALAGFRVEGAAWATAGRPVRGRARIWNKGALRLPAQTLRWETPNPGVRLSGRVPLPAILPGKFADVPLEFTVADESRPVVQTFAMLGAARLPLEIPLFPPAPPAQDYRIIDGRTVRLFQHAVEKQEVALGEGNADGALQPGETFAIVLPDGDGYRAAELFTNDACIDNATRISDVWSAYDHVGASAKYSLPVVRPDCPEGHEVRMLARVLLPDKPNHKLRYATIATPVVKRPGLK